MGLKVASKLLNKESRSMAKSILDIRYIPRNQIQKNPKNRISIDGIEELAQDIKMAGLEQPLVVYPKDGGYMLLTGERRLTAIDTLIESGDWNPEKDFIPCIERPLDFYKLPLDDDLKERYAILRTNAFNRKPTDADLVIQAEDYGRIIKCLKSKGYKEMIIGYDDNGDPIKQDISGRTRQAVADMVGVSSGQVGKVENILKNGTERLKEAVRNGEMSIAAADQLASYEEGEQNDFLENNDNPKVTASQVIRKMGESKAKAVEEEHDESIGSNEEENAVIAENDDGSMDSTDSYVRKQIETMRENMDPLQSAWDSADKEEFKKAIEKVFSAAVRLFYNEDLWH